MKNTPTTYSVEQRDENTVIVWGPNANGEITNVMQLWFDGAFWNRIHAYGRWTTLESAVDAAIAYWSRLMEGMAR